MGIVLCLFDVKNDSIVFSYLKKKKAAILLLNCYISSKQFNKLSELSFLRFEFQG